MRHHRLLLLAALTGIAIAGTACTDAATPTSPPLSPLRSQLVKEGFPDRLIVEEGDRFIVDGDIVLLKADVARRAGGISRPAGPRFQYISNYVVPGNGSIQIGVNLNGLAGASNWADAMRQAFAEYNAVGGQAIHFVERNNSYASTSTSTFNTVSSVVAQANYPNGSPGKLLSVNRYYDWFTLDQKKLVLAHELGHIIGFLHADWITNGESALTGTHLIGSTPVNDQDSFMQSHSGGLSWSGFPYYDKMALRLAYKGEGPNVTGAMGAGNHPVLSWAPQADAVSYDVWLINKTQDEQTGLWVDGSWEYVGTTTATTLTDAARVFGAVSPTCDPYTSAPSYNVLVSYPGGAITYGSPFGGACFQ